jgi:glycosyltransferase involved in cell wall biosynthesis
VGLPGYRQLWGGAPFLYAWLGAAAVTACVWSVLGRLAALMCAVVLLSASEAQRAVLYVPPSHVLVVLHAGVLCGTLIFVYRRVCSGRLSRPLLVLIGAVLALFTGAGLTDQMVLIGGLAPFMLAPLACWSRLRSRASGTVAVFVLLTGVLSVAVELLVTHVMQDQHVVHAAYPIDFVASEALFSSLQNTIAGWTLFLTESPPVASAATMHIGLNLIFLVPGETGGMEVYARELIPELISQAPRGTRFTAFVNREAATASGGPWGELLPAVTVPVSARDRMQWVLGEQALLPPLAARRRVGLVHSLGSTAPLWGPFRRVTTVHDLIYARFPDAHQGLRDRGMRVLVPAAARRSRRVIAISQSTRADLIELLGVPAAKIDVVPQGLGAIRHASPLSEHETRARFDLGERAVVLSVSAKRPHKNLLALIGALALVPPERRPLLVLPGYPTWHEEELRARAEALGVSADVRLLGWVSASELEGLWELARAFVFPSLYEGFGLPVLEAMARGVPVACSNSSSLPEVAGDAALLFDPRDPRAIAAAVQELLSIGEPARARVRARGIARASQLTWRRTAQLTLESYARALGSAAAEPALAAPE